VLKYRKYKHLDLSNIKEITANEAGIAVLPKWIVKDCLNIKKLNLDENQIKTISN
jgi:hypothetical protein